MFTRRFFIAISICIALALAGAWWQPLYYAALGAAGLLALLALIDGAAVLVISRRFTVKRSAGDLLSLAQPNPVTLDVKLHVPQWALRLVKVEAYDTYPYSFRVIGEASADSVGPLNYSVVPHGRGRHEFGTVRCFVYTRPLGLITGRRFIDLRQTVRVYPTFRHLDQLDVMAEQNRVHGPKRVRRAGNSTEFQQIRDYVPGDDIRAINWRASARSTALKVNDYTDERSKPIVPVLCAGPSMLIASGGISLLDRAASAAVALASSAVRHYDEAGLITLTHAGVDEYLKPERSSGTVARILDATAAFGLPPTRSERDIIDDPDVLPDDADAATVAQLRQRLEACAADGDYDALANFILTRLRRRSLIVLFANFENTLLARQAIPALQRISRRHTLAVVMFKNESIESTIRDTTSSKLSEMRLRAMCAHYAEEQALLVSYLRQQRINVIHTHPADLTSAVLSTYLDLKNRGAV